MKRKRNTSSQVQHTNFTQHESPNESQQQIESQPQIEPSLDTNNDLPTKEKRVRGPTRAVDVWNLPDGKRIAIKLNSLGQAVGDNYKKLVKFLGTLARSGELAPLTYPNWTKLPTQYKKDMWQMVEKKFVIQSNGKKWAMKSLAKKWRDWKAALKRKYFDLNDVPGCFANPPDRVLRVQWESLVLYWNSEEAKKRSAIYKHNRSNQKFPHITGTKSMAQVREELRERRADGLEPSRAEVFVETRLRRKVGKRTNEATTEAISKINDLNAEEPEGQNNNNDEDDILCQAIGKDQHSHVRTYGLGPSRSDIWGINSNNETMRTTLDPTINEENVILRKKLHVMEENYANIQTKLTIYDKLFEKLMSTQPNIFMEDDVTRGDTQVPSNSNSPTNSAELQRSSSYNTQVPFNSNAPTNSAEFRRSSSSSNHEPQIAKAKMVKKNNKGKKGNGLMC